MSEISVIAISVICSLIVSSVIISKFANEFVNKIIEDNNKWLDEVKDSTINLVKVYLKYEKTRADK